MDGAMTTTWPLAVVPVLLLLLVVVVYLRLRMTTA